MDRWYICDANWYMTKDGHFADHQQLRMPWTTDFGVTHIAEQEKLIGVLRPRVSIPFCPEPAAENLLSSSVSSAGQFMYLSSSESTNIAKRPVFSSQLEVNFCSASLVVSFYLRGILAVFKMQQVLFCQLSVRAIYFNTLLYQSYAFLTISQNLLSLHLP